MRYERNNLLENMSLAVANFTSQLINIEITVTLGLGMRISRLALD